MAGGLYSGRSGPVLVAHRAPGTEAGCAALAAAGAGVFEIDVRLRAGRLVASHYFAVPGAAGWLEHDNWRLRRRSRAQSDDDLTDRIAVVPPGCDVLLDLKERDPERRRRLVRSLLRQLPGSRRFVASSPDAADLDALRAAGVRTWRSVGDRACLRRCVADADVRDEALTVRHTALDEASISRAHARGLAVVAWTVNDARRARGLRAIGVDGLTTDRVAVLLALAA